MSGKRIQLKLNQVPLLIKISRTAFNCFFFRHVYFNLAKAESTNLVILHKVLYSAYKKMTTY